MPLPKNLPPLTALQKHHRDVMKAHGLRNPVKIIRAANHVGIPLPGACAMVEKETGGKNIYGHDPGGMFTVDGEMYVTEKNFAEFYDAVVEHGHVSNGVGPCQITYRGYFPEAKSRGLALWAPYDNMVFGFGILLGHYNSAGHNWQQAGKEYNGALVYGVDLAHKVAAWKKRLDS